MLSVIEFGRNRVEFSSLKKALRSKILGETLPPKFRFYQFTDGLPELRASVCSQRVLLYIRHDKLEALLLTDKLIKNWEFYFLSW